MKNKCTILIVASAIVIVAVTKKIIKMRSNKYSFNEEYGAPEMIC